MGGGEREYDMPSFTFMLESSVHFSFHMLISTSMRNISTRTSLVGQLRVTCTDTQLLSVDPLLNLAGTADTRKNDVAAAIRTMF